MKFGRRSPSGRVAALGQFDPQDLFPALAVVIFREFGAEPLGFYPDYVADARVKGWAASEDFDADRVFLDGIGAPGQGLLHYIAKKFTLTFRGFEGLAGENSFQVCTDC